MSIITQIYYENDVKAVIIIYTIVKCPQISVNSGIPINFWHCMTPKHGSE